MEDLDRADLKHSVFHRGVDSLVGGTLKIRMGVTFDISVVYKELVAEATLVSKRIAKHWINDLDTLCKIGSTYVIKGWRTLQMIQLPEQEKTQEVTGTEEEQKKAKEEQQKAKEVFYDQENNTKTQHKPKT